MSKLVIVATPIGNPDDITLRAITTLRECDVILAEDTRRTGMLLKHHGIQGVMKPFHAHSPDSLVDEWCEKIAEGTVVALVTDAGTPLVSDPGARLVAAVRARDLDVSTAPGVSAPIAALTVAGLRADRFRFVGFIARSGSGRREALETIGADAFASVAFESPRRIRALVEDLKDHIGDRRIAVCRELTKTHEEVIAGTCSEVLEALSVEPRGEITLVVEAAAAGTAATIDVDAFIEAGLKAGERAKDLSRRLARASGLSGQQAYAAVLALRKRLGY